MDQVITLYHTNSPEICNDFLNNKIQLYVSDQNGGQWLGAGMYFWDNLSNARYWGNQKLKRISQCHIICVNVQFDRSNLLDLTDLETSDYIIELWEKYCEKTNTDFRSDLGCVLNTLFNAISELNNKFYLIKAIGNNYSTKSDLFEKTYHKKIRVSLSGKVIYNIRKEHIIKEKELKEIYYGERYKRVF